MNVASLAKVTSPAGEANKPGEARVARPLIVGRGSGQVRHVALKRKPSRGMSPIDPPGRARKTTVTRRPTVGAGWVVTDQVPWGSDSRWKSVSLAPWQTEECDLVALVDVAALPAVH